MPAVRNCDHETSYVSVSPTLNGTPLRVPAAEQVGSAFVVPVSAAQASAYPVGAAVDRRATVESASAIARATPDRISLFYFANWYTASVPDAMDHTTSAPSSGTPLGVPGYTFADLHQPERLGSLYDRFCEEFSPLIPALWREWDAYRRAPDEPRPPVELSNLLIAMAAHVSRFVVRLFDVSSAAGGVAAATRSEDDLFRFKVDFVRRRALPLLKGGAHVASTAEDDAIVRGLIGAVSARDVELAIARAGCALLDREKATGSSAGRSGKRWP